MEPNTIPLSSAKPATEYTIKVLDLPKSVEKILSYYGISPGEKIKLLFSAPSGHIHAYEIKNSVIALRSDYTSKIYIE